MIHFILNIINPSLHHNIYVPSALKPALCFFFSFFHSAGKRHGQSARIYYDEEIEAKINLLGKTYKIVNYTRITYSWRCGFVWGDPQQSDGGQKPRRRNKYVAADTGSAGLTPSVCFNHLESTNTCDFVALPYFST